jgi:hypothetical protein
MGMTLHIFMYFTFMLLFDGFSNLKTINAKYVTFHSMCY